MLRSTTLWLSGILLGTVALSACSGIALPDDPASSSGKEAPRGGSVDDEPEGTGATPSNGSSDPGGSTGGGSQEPTVDGGAGTPGADGGSDGGLAVPGNAFTDAPAYAAPAQLPGPIDEGAHNRATGRMDGDPAGSACNNATCHGAGTGGRQFLFGGTVYKGGNPVGGVEIRVRDAAGKAVSVYSNAQGNFYLRARGATLTGNVVTGARTGTSTHPMVTSLTVAAMGNCNACHTGEANKTPRVFVQ